MFQDITTTAAAVVAQVQAEMAEEGNTPKEIAAVKFTGSIFVNDGDVYFEIIIPGSWDGTVFVSNDGAGSLEASDVRRLREGNL